MVQKTRPQAETLSGSPQPNFTGYSVNPIISKRTPTANDTGYPLGQVWVDKSNDSYWALTSVSAGVATWQVLGAGGGSIATINLQPPIAGNFNIVGTANQITASTSSGTTTLSTPSTFIAPGSIASTTTLTGGTGITATTGNIIATAGNLQLNGTTNSVKINASAPTTSAVGFVTLSGSATTTLTSSAITASSIILFSLKTLGTLTASAITYTTTAGSATITPAGSTDTSVYGYLIIN